MNKIAPKPEKEELDSFLSKYIHDTPNTIFKYGEYIHNYYIDGRIVQTYIKDDGKTYDLLIFCITEPKYTKDNCIWGSVCAEYDFELNKWNYREKITGINTYKCSDIVNELTAPYSLKLMCNRYCSHHVELFGCPYTCEKCNSNLIFLREFQRCVECYELSTTSNKPQTYQYLTHFCNECFSKRTKEDLMDGLTEDNIFYKDNLEMYEVHGENGLHKNYTAITCNCNVLISYNIDLYGELKLPKGTLDISRSCETNEYNNHKMNKKKMQQDRKEKRKNKNKITEFLQ